jgi:hypothetical protein
MNNGIVLGSRRILQPGRLQWLRAIGWAVLLFALVLAPSSLSAGIVYAVASVVTGTPIPHLMEEPGPIHFTAMVAMSLTALVTYAGLVSWGEQRRPAELALKPALAEVPVGIAIGFAMMSLVVLLGWAAGWVTLARAPLTNAWGAVAMAIESGIVEEVMMRLIVFRLLWRAFGPWWALAGSALVFGLLHIVNPNASLFATIAIAIEAGIMLAAFYILTGRLWVSIGAHAGWNFTQGWIYGAPVSGTALFEGGPLDLRPAAGVPEILSGGAFGPEASLMGLLVGTSVGALTLWLCWQRGRFETS